MARWTRFISKRKPDEIDRILPVGAEVFGLVMSRQRAQANYLG